MSESTVFVVRVWPGAGRFRATARAVERDETVVFTEPAELLRFLHAAAPSEPAAPLSRSRSAAAVTIKPPLNEERS